MLPRACPPSHSGTQPQNKPPFKELDMAASLEPRPGLPCPVPAPPRPQQLTHMALTLTTGLCPPARPPFTLHLSVDTARNAPL